MLDLLHLSIPFRPEHVQGGHGYAYLPASKARDEGVKGEAFLASLGVKIRAEDAWLDEDGFWHCQDLRHPFDSLPSSHTGIAFKIVSGSNFYPYVSLKASPAKILQGHNVFGPTSIKLGAFEFLSFLASTHPKLSDALDYSCTEVMQLDCTFSARLPSDKLVEDVINHLRKVSSGQTYSRESARGLKRKSVCSYDTTIYFGGSDSRLKTLKLYLKSREFIEQLNDLKKKALRGDSMAARIVSIMSDKRLLDWASGLLRLESSLKSRWLQRKGLSTNLYDLIAHQDLLASQGRCFIREIWQDSTADLFRALEGHSMRIVDDTHVREALRAKFSTVTKLGNVSFSKADRIFAFYERLCDRGFDHVQSTTPRNTLWRYIQDLKSIGLSTSYLQNISPDSSSSNIIPIMRLVDVSFDSQLPDWYVEPVSSFDVSVFKAA